MGLLINSTYITVDGVIQDPQDWPALGSSSEQGGEMQTELLLGSDAVLMGRRTYEGFAPVWTGRSGDAYSDRINAMPKYVASTTLTDPTWNNTTVIATDLVERVTELKQATAGTIVQYGFGAVSHTLLDAGLMDELRLWMHPFLLGRGGIDALLYRESATAVFDLKQVVSLDSGIVVLTYARTAG